MADRLLTPIDILGASLIEWWDANSGLTVAAGIVTQWTGRLLKLPATQPTTTLRPTYSNTARNGQPGVIFSGTQRLQFAPGNAPVPQSTQALTLAASGYFDATSGSGMIVSYGQNTSGGMPAIGVLNGKVAATAYDNNLASTEDWVQTDKFVQWDHPGGNTPVGSLYSNGVLVANAAMAIIRIARSVGYIGNIISTDTPWKGTIQQIMIINTAPSLTQRQQLEGWESWYTGKAGANLPAGHPYKNAAPTTATTPADTVQPSDPTVITNIPPTGPGSFTLAQDATVLAAGHGGGGSGISSAATAWVSGSGGAYARGLSAVLPAGTVLYYNIGTGGPGALSSNGSPGSATWLRWDGVNAPPANDTQGIIADGADAATLAAIGAAGAAADSLGNVVRFSGGLGRRVTATAQVGGGSSAGTAANGNNNTTGTGATAPTGGGNGGAGASSQTSTPVAGARPGGGGGNARATTVASAAGGDGALSFTISPVQPPPVVLSRRREPQLICG